MSDKIAAECCGSCLYWDAREHICKVAGKIDYEEGKVEEIIVHEDEHCKHYTPRNPIENKFEKMWKEIMLRCMVMSDPAFQEVIKWMRELEKENKS